MAGTIYIWTLVAVLETGRVLGGWMVLVFRDKFCFVRGKKKKKVTC